jgi:hypothetical protein
MTFIEYPSPASSLPDLQITWEDQNGNPIDFSTGWTFKMTIAQPPNPAKITKMSGFSAGNGTPNLTIMWSPNELSTLTPGRWAFQVTATNGPSGGKQRIFNGTIRIDQPIIS